MSASILGDEIGLDGPGTKGVKSHKVSASKLPMCTSNKAETWSKGSSTAQLRHFRCRAPRISESMLYITMFRLQRYQRIS